MASKLKSVQIINNSVIKIYRNADREGRIINILNSYYTDIINTPRIIDIENGKITMEKLKACRIDWRKNKENDIINYIGNAAESLGRLHCINNNDLNESLPVETLNISEFIEKKYRLYMSDYGGKYIDQSKRMSIEKKIFGIFSSSSNLSSSFGFCHGDYCYQNVLEHNNSCYLIDFENSNISYQIDDIARYLSKILLLTIEIKNIDFELLEKTFIDSYNKHHSFDKKTYDLLLFIYLLNIRSPLTFSINNIYKFPKILFNRGNYNQLISNHFNNLCKI